MVSGGIIFSDSSRFIVASLLPKFYEEYGRNAKRCPFHPRSWHRQSRKAPRLRD
jgi:hypothetical protein